MVHKKRTPDTGQANIEPNAPMVLNFKTSGKGAANDNGMEREFTFCNQNMFT